MEVLLACAAIGLVAIGYKIYSSRTAKRQEALEQAASDATDVGSEDAEKRLRAALVHAQRHWGRGTPTCAPPLYALASFYDKRGDSRRAIRFYGRVIDAARGASDYAQFCSVAREQLAWCHVYLGDLAAARQHLDQLESEEKAEQDGFFIRTAICRAVIARHDGSPELTEALVKSWLKASIAWSEKDAYRTPPGGTGNPPSGDGASDVRVLAYRELAEALDAQNRTAEAQRWRLAAVLSMQHDSAKDSVAYEYEVQRMALAAESDRDWEAALQHWRVLEESKHADTRARALVARGHCEEQIDRPLSALRSYERVLETDAQHESKELVDWVWLRIAELRARRDPQGALRAFEQSGAGRTETELFDAIEVATAEWLSGRRRKAEKWIDRQADTIFSRDLAAPKDAEALAGIAEWNVSRGRIELAQRAIEKALALAGEKRMDSSRLALRIVNVRSTLARYGARFDEVERLVGEVDLLPSDAVGHAWSSVERGVLADDLGQHGRAARHYQDALDIAPQKLVARTWLAHVTVLMIRALVLSGETGAAIARRQKLDDVLDDEIPEFSGPRCVALALDAELAIRSDDVATGDALLVRGIELLETIFGFAPWLRTRRAELLFSLRRHEEAGKAASQALEEAEGIYADSHPILASANLVRARVAAAAGETALARELFGQAFAALEQHSHAGAPAVRQELAAFNQSCGG